MGGNLRPNTALKLLLLLALQALITVSPSTPPSRGGGNDDSLFIVTLNFRCSKEDFVGVVFLMAATMTYLVIVTAHTLSHSISGYHFTSV